MKVNSRVLAVIILVVIFGGIALSTALGWWQTEGGGGQGAGHGQGGEDGESTGQVDTGGYGDGGGGGGNATSIRGRTTFQELLDLGLPVEAIEQVIGGPIPDPAMRVRIYCDENGLDFEVIKEQLEIELARLGDG